MLENIHRGDLYNINLYKQIWSISYSHIPSCERSLLADVGNPDLNQATWTDYRGSYHRTMCFTDVSNAWHLTAETRHTLHNHIRANQSCLCQTIAIIQELLPNTNSSPSHRTRVIFNLEKKIRRVMSFRLKNTHSSVQSGLHL